MRLGWSGRSGLWLLIGLVTVSPLGAVDIRALIQAAQDADLELKRAVLAGVMAGNGVERQAAARGLKLGAGTSGGGPLEVTADFEDPFELTLSTTPALSLTLPEPASTRFSLSAPLSLVLPAGTFTPRLSLGAEQSLAPLVGAAADRRVRRLTESLDLSRVESRIQERKAEVALRVLSALKLVEELGLQIADIEQDLLDIAEEDTRARALDPDGPPGPAARQIADRTAAAEEGLARTRAALAARRARLARDLGTPVDTPPEGLPTEAGRAPVALSSAAVRAAEMELELARANLDRQVGALLPTITAAGSLELPPVSLSLSVGVWFPILDGGARALDRRALELVVEDRELALRIARQVLEADVEDLAMEAQSLADRLAAARRALVTATEDHAATAALVDAGIRSARELDRAAHTVDRRKAELRLLSYDLLTFEYQTAAQGITAAVSP